MIFFSIKVGGRIPESTQDSPLRTISITFPTKPV